MSLNATIANSVSEERSRVEAVSERAYLSPCDRTQFRPFRSFVRSQTLCVMRILYTFTRGCILIRICRVSVEIYSEGWGKFEESKGVNSPRLQTKFDYPHLW